MVTKVKGKGRFNFNTGEMDYQMIIKDPGPIRLNIGRFHPHVSTKGGPNGQFSTWMAAMDALAFMHHPLRALKLLGWMYDQQAFSYILWFVALNVIFGIPYIIWYHILDLWRVAQEFLARYPEIYYNPIVA